MGIMLIDEDGTKISNNIDFKEALLIANKKDKDLVLVNEKNKVYRIADEGKLKYDRKQKERSSRTKRRAQKMKEIQLRPTIEDADLNTKMRRVNVFLENGLKTKLVMKFKRRQMASRDSGMQKIKDIVNQIVEKGIATADKPPVFEGFNIIVFLTPIKKLNE